MKSGKVFLGCLLFLMWGVWLLLYVWYCLGFALPILRLKGEWVLPVLLALTLLVLVRVLAVRRNGDAGHERRLGLLGSFLLGVTPLGVTAIAVATSVASVRETFDHESPPIDLACYNEMQPSDIKFFIGVDISQSFLRKDTETRAQVCEILRRMLARDEGIEGAAPAIPPMATAEVWHFGATPVRVERQDPGEFADPWISELAESMCRQLDLVTATSPSQSLTTDVLGFLEEIASDVESALMKGERVAIILISDLLQDAGEKGSEVERRLRDLAARFHAAGKAAPSNAPDCAAGVEFTKHLAILGLTIEHEEERRYWSDTRPIDLVPLLEQRLPEHFQRIAMIDLLGLHSPHDLLQLIGATSAEIRIDVGDPLFLKYRPDGKAKEGELCAEIRHALPPPGADKRPTNLALQLRTRPDRGSLPRTVQLRYYLDDADPCDGRAPHRLGHPPLLTSEDARSTWNPERVGRDKEGTIRVWLASPLDLSRAARLELLLAVPERGIVYAIPVTIMPVLGSDTIEVFNCIVLFFAACGLSLALSHAWNSRDDPVWHHIAGICQWRTLIGKAAGRTASALSRVRDRFIDAASGSHGPAPHDDEKRAAGGPP